MAAENLIPGTILDEGKMTVKKVKVEDTVKNFFSSTSGLVGMRMRGYLRRGFAITAIAVEKPAHINYGDIIKIIARGGGVYITAEGRALQKGVVKGLFSSLEVAFSTM